MNKHRLEGKTVIVTGGGGGMGRAMALGLAAEGANVVVMELAEAAARSTCEAIGADRSLAIAADVCKLDDCRRAVAATLARFGAVHGLVNNAGRGMNAVRTDFMSRPVRFWEVEPERWQALMDLNLRGPFYMASAVAPHMVEGGYGRIVNITTSLDTMYRGAYTPYGPSKAALEASTVGWARDLEGTGVTCNALIPGGAVNTAFFDASAPLNRDELIQPEAMCAPACWLMSADSAHVTAKRFVARQWDASLPDAQAAEAAGAPAAWQAMGAQSLWPGAKPVA